MCDLNSPTIDSQIKSEVHKYEVGFYLSTQTFGSDKVSTHIYIFTRLST